MSMFGRHRIETITPRAASDRFFMAQLVLVDVRSHHEYEEVRVPGALHIPVTEVRRRLHEIPTEHPVAFLCRSGHRSALAARTAARQRDDVLNVAGGMDAWLAADLPVARCRLSHTNASAPKRSRHHA